MVFNFDMTFYPVTIGNGLRVQGVNYRKSNKKFSQTFICITNVYYIHLKAIRVIKSVLVDVLGTLKNEHIFMVVSTKCSSDLKPCRK